ncbi:MAG: WD40 repeat domain-containing protein, partial [Candidatus Binatia bacterium]
MICTGPRGTCGHGRRLALLGLFALLAGCQADQRYVGVGDVVGTEPGHVTIRHDRIYGLMAPGTTRFAVADDAAAALARGGRVRFELHQRGAELLVTEADGLAEGNPGIHDHTPHHGGVVSMQGMIHLEAIAQADGRLRLYLTDLWRRPLPLDAVQGTATIDVPAGKRVVALARGPSALEANGPPLTQASVDVAFNLLRADGAIEAHFRLPLDATAGGAAGIPAAGCVAPPTGTAVGAPRCTLRFARGIAALGSSVDATALLVAVVDHGVSAWRLPAGEFTRGFAPPPPVAVPVAEAPHPEAPNAVVVRPDGREAVVAMENRLIRYAMDSGQVVRAYDGPGGIVRAVAWSPDGARLLVSTFYHPQAVVLDAADGRVLRRLAVEREGAAVAFAADGRRAAVGSENGTIALFDLDREAAPRVLHGARGP